LTAAVGDCPDRFGGYDTICNADALRLCAAGSDTVDAEPLAGLAKTYYSCLSRARLDDHRAQHSCDAAGGWSCRGDDDLVQSRVARALAAVIVSELPIALRLSAAEWWSKLLPIADHCRSPVTAAQWLIAIGQLRTADPGRDLDRAAVLADLLIEDCYYAIRSTDWEWFEPRWRSGAACIPAGLWHAQVMLDDRRAGRVAHTTMQFLIDNLFKDSILLPVGTRGGWHRGTAPARFDQLPAEVAGIVEALTTAAQTTHVPIYAEFARRASEWFTGRNIRGESLIDLACGGCSNAIKADGLDRNQGASAILSYLLAQAAVREPARKIESSTPWAASIYG